MTEQEWLETNDVPLMIKTLWELPGSDESVLVPALHRYFLACCRRIWKLLPDDSSRGGVEVAERYLAGKATDEELSALHWDIEAAAHHFDCDSDCASDEINQWVEQTRAIPDAELRALLCCPEAAHEIDTYDLLRDAAYFVHFAVCYSSAYKGWMPPGYELFLSADLLRELFGNPFEARRDRHS